MQGLDISPSRFVGAIAKPCRDENAVFDGCAANGSHTKELEIIGMLVGLCGIGSERNLRRRTAHVQEAIRVVTLAMVVSVWRVKASQQVVGRYPSVQALGLAGYDLDVQRAIWKLKGSVSLQVRAHIVENRGALVVW